jgi:hypothetical protein
MEGEPVTVDAMKGAVAYVADEYTKEWQRKAALETRAFAIGTAVFALATLFGVWIDRLKLLDDLADCSIAKWVSIGALALAVVAFGLALGGAILFRFKGADPDDISNFLKDVSKSSMTDVDALDEIARTYLGQLRAARAANARKFWMLAWAAGLLSIATVGAAVSLVTVGV